MYSIQMFLSLGTEKALLDTMRYHSWLHASRKQTWCFHEVNNIDWMLSDDSEFVDQMFVCICFVSQQDIYPHCQFNNSIIVSPYVTTHIPL